jgi:hypothetical protein
MFSQPSLDIKISIYSHSMPCMREGHIEAMSCKEV